MSHLQQLLFAPMYNTYAGMNVTEGKMQRKSDRLKNYACSLSLCNQFKVFQCDTGAMICLHVYLFVFFFSMFNFPHQLQLLSTQQIITEIITGIEFMAIDIRQIDITFTCIWFDNFIYHHHKYTHKEACFIFCRHTKINNRCILFDQIKT